MTRYRDDLFGNDKLLAFINAKGLTKQPPSTVVGLYKDVEGAIALGKIGIEAKLITCDPKQGIIPIVLAIPLDERKTVRIVIDIDRLKGPHHGTDRIPFRKKTIR